MKKLVMCIILMAGMILSPINQVSAEVHNIDCQNESSGQELTRNNIAKEKGESVTLCYDFDNGIKKEVTDVYVDDVQVSRSVEKEIHELTVSYTIPEKALENDTDANGIFLITARAGEGGSSSKDKTDGSITVKCYSTVKYELTQKNGKDYIKYVKASGGLQSLTGHDDSSYQGSGVGIRSYSVTVGYDGIDQNGKSSHDSVTLSRPNKPGTWSYTPNWPAVAFSQGSKICKLGCNQTVTLARNESTWKLSLVNNVD